MRRQLYLWIHLGLAGHRLDRGLNPFPTLVTFEVTSHFGVWGRTNGPCGPRAPVQSVQGRANLTL
jgi:hypothetical protein